MSNNYELNRIIISKSRRSGQALILSVLVMIFIVLLGTTFISIVASNMSNTARTGAKDEARQAANAGVLFADQQLSGSMAGLGWRPDQSTVAGSSYYYTAFDKAMGWNQEAFKLYLTDPNPVAQFVKYPNPDGSAVTSAHNTANFMLRVSQVESTDTDITGDTKVGDIRIESIGFASDDPTAYYRVVAYKQGTANNPLTAAMRSISNWDFSHDAVPHATVISSNDGANFIVARSESQGLSIDDAVTVFDPVTNAVGHGVIQGMTSPAVPYPTTSQLTITPSLSFTPSPRSIIQKAAIFGIPDNLQIQFDNQTNSNPPVSFHVSASKDLAGNDINTPGSTWVNGGLIWSGQDFLTHLVADTPGTIGSNIKVSGVYTQTASAQVMASAGDMTTVGAIPVNSADPNYASNGVVTAGLIEDGANRLRGSSVPTRQVREFTPPDITTGGEGFGRYRQLTQYSQSTDINYPQASAYGYGQGIYINNPTDVEKVGSTPMTQKQLQDLWFGTGTTNIFNRIGTPDKSTDAPNPTPEQPGGSLEEQHMRGWVSPDQFLPRGAEVIINNNATITINLDPLADNSSDFPHANFASNSPTPNPTKAWRNADGSLAGDSTTGGVYSRKNIPWPANGTIFAEGNVRIRGTIDLLTSGSSPAPRSLTIVSMNNIYIDGSLKLDSNKKVLLLAKKNVIVNPTLALAPVQAVTTLSEDESGSTSTIHVHDTSNFREGDYITFAQGSAPVRRVTVVGANTLTLDVALSASGSPGRLQGHPVYTVFDPRTDSGYYTTTYTQRPYNTAIRLTRQSDVLQRRVSYPSGKVPANLRIAFRHSAEYKKALTLQMDNALAKGVPASVVDDPTQAHTDMELAAVTNKALEEAYKGQSVITPGADSAGEYRNKYLKIKYRESVHTTDPITGIPDPITYDVDTDLFAVDRIKSNEDTYSVDPYPYQNNTGNLDDRYSAANVSLGHLLKQMIDRHASDNAGTIEYDRTHWRYGELNTGPTIYPGGAQIENNFWDLHNAQPIMDGSTPANTFDTDNAKKPRYYFMASAGNRLKFDQAAPSANPSFGAEDANPDGDWPQRQEFYPTPATGVTIPMATSVWLWMNGQQAILQDNTFNTLLNSFGNVLQFGFSPLLRNRDRNGNQIVTDAPYSDYADWEDSLTSDQYFYQPRNVTNGEGVENITKSGEANRIDPNYQSQSEYDAGRSGTFLTHYTLGSRIINNISPTTENEIAMSLNDALVDPDRGYTVQDYFGAKAGYNSQYDNPADPNYDDYYNIPYYRLSNMKLQDEMLDPTSHDLTQIGTGTTLDINAYAYAQEGGWQVIPGADFDNDVQNGQDLNRDGVISSGEQVAAYRYNRYNYQIVFHGAIMENQTASMDHVKAWTEKWATVKMDVPSTPAYTFGTTGDPQNSNFNTILYYYDPTAAQGALATDIGFHLPVATGGLIYQG